MRRFCDECLELINRCFLSLLLLIFAAVLVWARYHEIPFPNQCSLENIWYVIPAGMLLMLLFWRGKKERCDITDRIYYMILEISGIIGGGTSFWYRNGQIYPPVISQR